MYNRGKVIAGISPPPDMLEYLQAFFSREITLQRGRFILWSPVFMGTGIGLYFMLPFEPPFMPAAILWAIIAAISVLLQTQAKTNACIHSIRPLFWSLLIFISGFCLAQMQTMRTGTILLAKELGPVQVIGTVEDTAYLEPGEGMRIVLGKLSIENLEKTQTPEHVRIKIRKGGDALKPGMRISVVAGLNPPAAPDSPGAFDFQRYAYFKNIGAFGFSYQPPEILEALPPNSLSARMDLLRQKIGDKINAALEPTEAAFASALITGERSAISEEDWKAMRTAGLAHLLAISGMHIGMLAGLVFFLTRFIMVAAFPRFALNQPVKKYAAALAMASAFFYVLLVGAPVTTQRAMLMTGIVLFAVMIDRNPFSLRLVAISALAVLAFSPQSMTGASFQMSFAAVTALVAFYEWTRVFWRNLHKSGGRLHKIALYFLGICATTLVASSATSLFSIYHFQQYAVFDLPANLVAVPALAFIVMPAAILTVLLMPFGLESLGLRIMEPGLRIIVETAQEIEALPFSMLHPHALPLSFVLMMVSGALIVILWRGYGRIIGLILMAAGIMTAYNAPVPDMLVSSSGKLFAIQGQDNKVYASSRIYDRFALENWAQRYGLANKDEIHKFPFESYDRESGLSCGEYGCRFRSGLQRVAISYSPAGMKEDCGWADIMVARYPLSGKLCDSPTRIDAYDIWALGGHAFYLSGEKPMIRSVGQERGTRPWTVSNQR